MVGVTASSPSGVTQDLGADEAHLGGTPETKAANSAMRALSRAARAFALYDSKNVIIRRFLSEYRETMEGALAKFGEQTFSVEPFELKLKGETVYKEVDRERSLAFRLFRDGVRSLTLHPGLPWDECVRLLEILSVRFAGTRAQEDDVVTLLRKAAFTKIDFTAAVGFAPAEDNPEPGAAARTDGEAGGEPTAGPRGVVHAPPDFDLPLPELLPALAYGYRDVPLPYLDALRAEEAPALVPTQAVKLCLELLTEANGPASPLGNDEVAPLCQEVRDYCIADGAYGPLLALVRALKSQHGIGAHVLEPVVTGLGAPDVIERLLDALPRDATEAPQALADLLNELPGNPVARLVERLNATEDPGQQRLLKQLMLGVAKTSSDSLIQSLHTAQGKSASQIVEVLMVSAPEQALNVATELAQSDDPAAHLEALSILEKAPRTDALSALLLRLSGSADDAVFARTAQVMAAVHERRGYDLLARQAEARATAKTLTRESATAVGEALATLGPGTALGLFRTWAHPKGGLLGKLRTNEHDVELQMVAVAGLAVTRLPEAEALLKDVHAHTSSEPLKLMCVSAVARRRKLFGPGPAGGAPHGR